jgi:hypothetical protein
MSLKSEVSLHVSAFKASYLSLARKKHFGNPTRSKAEGKMIKCVPLSPIASGRIYCTLICACSVGARKRVYCVTSAYKPSCLSSKKVGLFVCDILVRLDSLIVTCPALLTVKSMNQS